jgi:hypothetical protein
MVASLELTEELEDQNRTIVILNIRRMNDEGQNQAHRVDDDVTFAAVDLLARIVAPLATDLGRLDRLAVDDRSTGRSLATFAASEHVSKHVVNLLPGPIVTPTEKESVDRLPVGVFVGEITPSATAAREVKNRVDRCATTNNLGSSPARRLWQQLAKNLPLIVEQVRGIFRLFHVGHRYDSFRSLAGIEGRSYRFSLI